LIVYGTAENSLATVRATLDAGVMLIDAALNYTRAGIESHADVHNDGQMILIEPRWVQVDGLDLAL
jgi:hypothetical protein